MFCINAYYPDGDEKQKLNCKNEKKLKEDEVFGEKCPLTYYCTVTERYENTYECMDCEYWG